ncbi:peptidase M14 [Muricauda sp. JGD-17]|uniref:Peptidase M14 n=1 Tax=Flagellimonas ochracea TaxID=2696472 RepID=A0A964WWQ4_9FLAO|nr:M14 metallopeptidase family protein [Allomuricauda ochracea]NAY91027.1 peptidase M14 [Allomuricauda ochracea]
MIDYIQHKEHSVQGRYVTMAHLREHWLPNLNGLAIDCLGQSVNSNSILGVTMGSGANRILMWSQMHGNESTTTKAVLDLVNFLKISSPLRDSILEQCTLYIIPMLNPDGADTYTRQNANGIDLNRDAKELSQPESRILRSAFEKFQPHYCFNLHDQRTLFAAGQNKKSATVSFLAPASNSEREITPARGTAMQLILAMNRMLQSKIPGQVGRYDDAFNDNCVGDAFQMQEVPTILFEAGHYPNDYMREKTRELIFYAFLEVLQIIVKQNIELFDINEYFDIPENEKSFYDILIRNANRVNHNLDDVTDVGIQFKEVLENGAISFVPEIAAVENLDAFFGHRIIECSNAKDRESLAANKDLLDLVASAEKK